MTFQWYVHIAHTANLHHNYYTAYKCCPKHLNFPYWIFINADISLLWN